MLPTAWDPILHEFAARQGAVEGGLLVDITELAHQVRFRARVALHVSVLEALQEHREEAAELETFTSILRTARVAIQSDGLDFDHIYAYRSPAWLGRLAVRRTVLDSGEDVVTIYRDPFEVFAAVRSSSTGSERLPTGDELVSALRAIHCDPRAPIGRRQRGLPPCPYTPGADHWEDKEETRALIASDPAEAARRAERHGDMHLAIDCWLLAGDVEGALEVSPPGELIRSNFGYWLSPHSVVLATLAQRALRAADVVRLYPSSTAITDWVIEHPEVFLGHFQQRLDAAVGAEGDLVGGLLLVPDLMWDDVWPAHSGFVHTPGGPRARIPFPRIERSKAGADIVRSLIRDAENGARRSVGQHAVGEGWTSETELYLQLKEHFGQITQVEHHGRPPGLAPQHLDVWLPEWRVGVEFQGEQHDGPVEFFGGEEGHLRTVERDARKRDRCRELGIALIEVRPGYVLAGVVAEILAASENA